MPKRLISLSFFINSKNTIIDKSWFCNTDAILIIFFHLFDSFSLFFPKVYVLFAVSYPVCPTSIVKLTLWQSDSISSLPSDYIHFYTNL